MKNDSLRRRIKVGLFLAISAAIAAAMMIVIGGAQHPFSRKAYLHSAFKDTMGLSIGAPVRLGGLDVGTVQDIQFTPSLTIKEVSVTMAIEARYLERIRGDSRAMLTPNGLLGDSFIAISVGTHTAPPLADGGFLPSMEGQSMGQVMSSLDQGLDEIRSLSRGLREHLDMLVTPEVARDFGRFVHAAADSAETVQQGNGLAHALIYDHEMSAAARSVARSATRSANDLAAAMTRIDRIAAAVESGDGTLHRLIARDDAGPILADATRAAHELAALSRTLKQMGDDVAAGKGTMGALLEDPTIYEDLKIILGDVRRNMLLKALVRFTVQHDRLHQDPAPLARLR